MSATMFIGGVLVDGTVSYRKLSETSSQKRRVIFDHLVQEYGSVESIPLEAWRKVLDPESFRVTRLCLAESCHSGKYINNCLPGIYSCICCGSGLFDSLDKYGSIGWMCFSQSISKVAVEKVPEDRFGNKRIEVRCARCKAHLGVSFDDPASETGERFTINSCSLDFNLENYDAAIRKASMYSL